jgi:hypothetical protein
MTNSIQPAAASRPAHAPQPAHNLNFSSSEKPSKTGETWKHIRYTFAKQQNLFIQHAYYQ